MKKTKIYKKFLIVFLFVLGLNSSSFAFLKASGQQIVDSTGSTVILRGFGLGGWLVPEGYMLHTPGYGSPTSIYNQIVDVVGIANAEIFFSAYRANYVNKNDIAKIADWGFNSIRLPFHYKLFYDPVQDVFLESGFALVDSLLDWCDDYGIYVILDMHCAPGGQNDSNISDSDGTARLWTEPNIYQPMTVKVWKEIARRYASDPRVGGYDLINEPVLPNGVTPVDLRNLYVQITDSIRTVDTNHIIFIEGNWYATDFTGLTPPWDSNMSYSFHKYWSDTDVGSIQGYLSMRSQHNVPLWLGETGENSNAWYYETVKLMADQQIGWAWWTHKKVETITSPYSAPFPPGYQDLINYWNGTGSKPSVSVAMNTLMALSENLKLENCDYRSGIIPSLTDPTFGTTPKPFKNHNLPGQFNAVDYDYGTQGIGYIDNLYRNINGSQYNNGYAYRNDGVDIEPSQDPLGYAYNVGWIASGERLMYTVNIAASGYYQGHFRIASTSANGLFMILLDGSPVTGLNSVPNTGGWQNWQTMTVDSIHLTQGTHQIMMLFNREGFNLNRLTFFLTTVGISDDDANKVADDFQLFQNYPNPFNPVTTISYNVPFTSDVKLNIYNLLGELVVPLVNGTKTAGKYQIQFDASGLSSGVYYYQLRSHGQILTRKMTINK
jgi:hypothetical protein